MPRFKNETGVPEANIDANIHMVGVHWRCNESS
jgi:hypothetical protein